MRTVFLRRVLYPLQETLQGRNFLRLLEEWSELQFRPPAELRDRQEEKLRQLFRHARRHVPFYAEKCRALGLGPEDIRRLEDLPKLPALSREQIRENFPGRMTADNIPRRRRMPRSQSLMSRLSSGRATEWVGKPSVAIVYPTTSKLRSVDSSTQCRPWPTRSGTRTTLRLCSSATMVT